jgi:aldose 1-epimerase
MTDHLYLNLRGHDSGLILDQLLTLHAHRFTPVAKGSIPTGELREVTGTPFDFTVGKAIGTDLEDDCEQLGLTGGFDHNFCIDGYTGDGSLLNAAHVSDPVSGRMLDVSTTQPGIQFYAGNYVGDAHAKDGVDYGPRSSFALETQFFPDTPHHDGFPQAFFGPGHDYEATTIYSFSAR